MASNHLDPHIWYSNDFPWSQDVKIDLDLGRPRVTSSDLEWPRDFKQPPQPQKMAHENRSAKRLSHVKYELSSTPGTPSNSIYTIIIVSRPKRGRIYVAPNFFDFGGKFKCYFIEIHQKTRGVGRGTLSKLAVKWPLLAKNATFKRP